MAAFRLHDYDLLLCAAPDNKGLNHTGLFVLKLNHPIPEDGRARGKKRAWAASMLEVGTAVVTVMRGAHPSNAGFEELREPETVVTAPEVHGVTAAAFKSLL